MENKEVKSEKKDDKSGLLFLNAMLVMTTGMTLNEAMDIAVKEDSPEAMQEALMRAAAEKRKQGRCSLCDGTGFITVKDYADNGDYLGLKNTLCKCRQT